MHSLHSNSPVSCSLLRDSWCWCHPAYPSLYIFSLSCCKGSGMGCFCRMVQQHAGTMQLCQPQAGAGIIAGHQHSTWPSAADHSPVFCTAVLGDSQCKTTMCSSRLSPKGEKAGPPKAGCGWGQHMWTQLALLKTKKTVFLSCLLFLSFACDSLLLSPAQGLARESQSKQLIRNCVWRKRINFMFSRHPCFVWGLKITAETLPAQICNDTYL